jgi:hypothetical protein
VYGDATSRERYQRSGVGVVLRLRLGIANPYTKKPISRDVLERAFADELEVGSVEMDVEAMRSMAAQIKKGNATMLIWYTKNRWGWRDHYDARLSTPSGEGGEAKDMVTGGCQRTIFFRQRTFIQIRRPSFCNPKTRLRQMSAEAIALVINFIAIVTPLRICVVDLRRSLVPTGPLLLRS